MFCIGCGCSWFLVHLSVLAILKSLYVCRIQYMSVCYVYGMWLCLYCVLGLCFRIWLNFFTSSCWVFGESIVAVFGGVVVVGFVFCRSVCAFVSAILDLRDKKSKCWRLFAHKRTRYACVAVWSTCSHQAASWSKCSGQDKGLQPHLWIPCFGESGVIYCVLSCAFSLALSLAVYLCLCLSLSLIFLL